MRSRYALHVVAAAARSGPVSVVVSRRRRDRAQRRSRRRRRLARARRPAGSGPRRRSSSKLLTSPCSPSLGAVVWQQRGAAGGLRRAGGSGARRRAARRRRARSSGATSRWIPARLTSTIELGGDRVGVGVGPVVAGAVDLDHAAVGQDLAEVGGRRAVVFGARAAAHRHRRHRDPGRIPRRPAAQVGRARPPSPGPRHVALRVRVPGSRYQRSSPIIRRMNRSAASAGSSSPSSARARRGRARPPRQPRQRRLVDRHAAHELRVAVGERPGPRCRRSCGRTPRPGDPASRARRSADLVVHRERPEVGDDRRSRAGRSAAPEWSPSRRASLGMPAERSSCRGRARRAARRRAGLLRPELGSRHSTCARCGARPSPRDGGCRARRRARARCRRARRAGARRLDREPHHLVGRRVLLDMTGHAPGQRQRVVVRGSGRQPISRRSGGTGPSPAPCARSACSTRSPRPRVVRGLPRRVGDRRRDPVGVVVGPRRAACGPVAPPTAGSSPRPRPARRSGPSSSTTSAGSWPMAVSPESITASVPSNTALATSLTSARVGAGA